jgi:hypothetical protein
MLLLTGMDSASNPTFNWVNLSDYNPETPNWGWTSYVLNLEVGDVNGDTKPDVYFGRKVFSYNTATLKFDQISSNDIWNGYAGINHWPDWETIAIGDVTGDGRADIVYFGLNALVYYYTGTAFTVKFLTGSGFGIYAGCLPSVDNDGLIAVYESHAVQFTHPQPITVIASAPYWDGVEYTAEGETTYGESTSGSSSEEMSGGFSVGASVGMEFSAFGTGMEAEASVTFSMNWSFAETSEWEETVSYSTPQGEDMIVFSATPYDVYYYKILSSALPEEYPVGEYFTVNVPRKPQVSSAELAFYNTVVGEANVITLKHSLGNPKTYYTEAEKNSLKTQYAEKGIFSSIFRAVGQGSGVTSISRSQSTSEEWSNGNNTELATEVKASVFGVKAGISAALNGGFSYTNTVGSGTEISGTVANLPTEAYTEASNMFTWGIMAFPQKDAASRDFYLVTYWVK